MYMYVCIYVCMPMRRKSEYTFFVETPAHDTANSATNFLLETGQEDEAGYFRLLSLYSCSTQIQLSTLFLFESQKPLL